MYAEAHDPYIQRIIADNGKWEDLRGSENLFGSGLSRLGQI